MKNNNLITTINTGRKQLLLCAAVLFLLLASACNLSQPGIPDTDLARTVVAQDKQIADLQTQVADLKVSSDSQWSAISYLATQMPIVAGIVTPTPPGAVISPTPWESATFAPMCTPPACAPDEMYFCPSGECINGCGTACATATSGPSSGIGQVWGAICPVGGSLPQLNLFFQDTSTLHVYTFTILENQASYQLELPAGVYVAYAWSADGQRGGSFSQYIVCGGTSHCTDHSLAPFLVQNSHVTTGIDLCDWSGEGNIPRP